MAPTVSTAARTQPAARLRGVLAPVVTPFKPDLSIDSERFVRHCKWLLKNGCSGLAVFGTNSEANSMSVEEKMTLLAALIHAGVPGSALMPGTGHCAGPATIRMTAHAVKHGCAGVLMRPPFYYKGVSDEGLYRYFAEVIERVGDERLRVYLYHIPPVSQVPISLKLIERLLAKYPGIVAGVKDSSGDWSNTKAMLDAFAKDGFDVFPGSETFLLAGMRNGGKGCISATANVNPAAIHNLYANWQSAAADKLQAGLDTVRNAFQKYPMIPAMKFAIAHWSGHAPWATVRPPLVEVTAEQSKALIADLEQCGFAMLGLKG
jgi:4-hydroxy-tetrahydrodipicolinate synthase